jgi:hypothetical protein
VTQIGLKKMKIRRKTKRPPNASSFVTLKLEKRDENLALLKTQIGNL